MQIARITLVLTLAAALATPSFAYSRTRRGPTSQKVLKKHNSAKPAPHAISGQRTISSERATELQQALIRNGYLTGEPSGQWDTKSEDAMRKLQADSGWQTKLVPDSRAIIKLGLGPKGDTVTSAFNAPSTETFGTK